MTWALIIFCGILVANAVGLLCLIFDYKKDKIMNKKILIPIPVVVLLLALLWWFLSDDK